jgi:phenylacetate-CoA ligase
MKYFSCDVFDKYGCREFSGMANECNKHEGLHINAENVIVEILKDGKPVGEDETGEVVVTDLHNLSTPFIRYRVGDTARYTNRRCSCGRGLPMIQNVEGRVQAIIQGTNGRYLVGTFFPHFVKDMKGVDEFQIRQDKFGEAVIYAVKNKKYSVKEEKWMLAEFKKYLGDDMVFHITEVREIPLYRGKRHHSISTLDFAFNNK